MSVVNFRSSLIRSQLPSPALLVSTDHLEVYAYGKRHVKDDN